MNRKANLQNLGNLTALKGFSKYLREERKRPNTIESYLRRVGMFLKVINKEPDKITKEDIQKWKEYCTGYHNNSLTPMYGAVKKYITYLADNEVVADALESVARRRLKAPKLKHDEDNIDKLVLKPEKFKQIFTLSKQSNFMHYALFKTMFWSQARRCEILGLKISDIDFDNRKITFREEIAKGGKRATVNIAQECLDILREYIDKVRDNPKNEDCSDILFLHNGKPLTRNRIWDIHNVYGEKLGFHITIHQWRHTGITEYAKVEKDLKLVQKQARHDDVNITMRYINYAKGTYDKSYHEKFAKSKPELKPESDKPSKHIEPKPQPPKELYASPQEESQDIMIQKLKDENDKLKAQLNNQFRGYE